MKMNKYNPSNDFRYNNIGFMSVLYILGFTDEEVENASIDEVINTIRDTHRYKGELTTRGEGTKTYIASDEFVKKQNLILSRMARRFYHNRHIAEYMVENEKD
jgi:hypothetical protein